MTLKMKQFAKTNPFLDMLELSENESEEHKKVLYFSSFHPFVSIDLQH